VKTRTIVSDMCSILEPKQMDTARYRRFSGTQKRQGPRMSSRQRLASLPRSRWVTGTGPCTPNCTYRNSGRANCSSSCKKAEVIISAWLENYLLLGKKKVMRGSYLLLTVPSNGWPPFQGGSSFGRGEKERQVAEMTNNAYDLFSGIP
jgi:hypothetical protein